MTDESVSCTQPARGPLAGLSDAPVPITDSTGSEEEIRMMARVGQPAPDFEATAFVDGGFKNVKLSDFSGHWVLLCFYPGDFTFV